MKDLLYFKVISDSSITVKYGDFSPRQLNGNTSGDFIFHNGYSSRVGPAEMLLVQELYRLLKMLLDHFNHRSQQRQQISFSIVGLTNLGLTIGDYLQINNEIVRIKETVSTTVVTSVY